MQVYILRRVLLTIPTVLAITLVVFMATRLLPGDAIQAMIGDFGAASPEVREALVKEYRLDGNVPLRYLEWLGELLRGDLGTSILSGRAVTYHLGQAIPVTAQLAFMSLILSAVVGIPLGVLSAVKRDSFWDFMGRGLAVLGLAVPAFWLALLTLTYGFRWFGWTPPIRYVPLWEDPVANLGLLVVPAVILATSSWASLMRYQRSTMLEVVHQDYVRTASSKGLRNRTVIWRHAFPNALIPVITVIGLQIQTAFNGTVILESIFSIPGMGRLLLNSISARDYPVVQGIVLLTATIVVVVNLVVDFLYAFVDPRIRYS